MLEMFDMNESEDDAFPVTVNYDGRHESKRGRNKLLTTGMQVHMKGQVIDRRLLAKFFSAAGVVDVGPLLNPLDRQNVPAAVRLLQLLLPTAEAVLEKSDALATWQSVAHDIRLVGRLGKEILNPILGGVTDADTSCSIEDALISFSTVAHLALFLYDEMGAAFIPSVLHHDLQATVKDAYYVAVKFAVDFNGADYNFFLSGSDSL